MAGTHILGNPNAKVSIVQYGDYECTICARTFPIIKELVSEFEGSVSYTFRHFPLSYIHPHAALAAVAAEVAAKYGKFWEMHELLMKNHANLAVEHILTLAGDLGLNTNIFFHDLESSGPMEEVITDLMSAQDNDIETSPTYFVNGTKLFGIVNYETLRSEILHSLPELRAGY